MTKLTQRYELRSAIGKVTNIIPTYWWRSCCPYHVCASAIHLVIGYSLELCRRYSIFHLFLIVRWSSDILSIDKHNKWWLNIGFYQYQIAAESNTFSTIKVSMKHELRQAYLPTMIPEKLRLVVLKVLLHPEMWNVCPLLVFVTGSHMWWYLMVISCQLLSEYFANRIIIDMQHILQGYRWVSTRNT